MSKLASKTPNMIPLADTQGSTTAEQVGIWRELEAIEFGNPGLTGVPGVQQGEKREHCYPDSGGMRGVVESMFVLQGLLLPSASSGTKAIECIRELRAKIPEPILAHFDRMIALGRKGVAPVRHGVCSACHIRVSIGTLACLVYPKDLYLCDSCGCYLLLESEEIDSLAESSTPAAAVIRKICKRQRAAEADMGANSEKSAR